MTFHRAAERPNPSSSHAYGDQPRQAIARARAQIAALIGAEPGEIVFTGSGSEADQLAIRGAVLANLRATPGVLGTLAGAGSNSGLRGLPAAVHSLVAALVALAVLATLARLVLELVRPAAAGDLGAMAHQGAAAGGEAGIARTMRSSWLVAERARCV